jgi:hypothetical protein
MMRRLLVTAILLLPSACGGGVSSDTTDDPVAQNVVEAAAAGTPAAVAAAVDCSNKPDFVPVYQDAQITTCVSGEDGLPRHVSGTIVYLTKKTPAEVLGWSREQVNASGLGQRLSTPTQYSAGEETRRSVMVLVEPMNGGTRVTVNWGRGV